MRIGVLTTGRQDWGILRSTCRALGEDPDFELRLFVGGMHLSPRFGATERLLEADAFSAAARIDWVGPPGQAAHVQAAAALEKLGEVLHRERLSALMLVG